MCSNDTRLENDPVCASDDEIDEWLDGKNLVIKGYDNIPDLSYDSKNGGTTKRRNDMGIFKLKRGVYYDTEARFKFHMFEAEDGWYFNDEKEHTFWSISHFKPNEMSVASNSSTRALI